MAKTSGGTRTFSSRMTIAEAQSEVIRVATIIQNNGGHSSKEAQVPPMNIGNIPSSIKDYALRNNIKIESDSMYITTKGIEHSLREKKVERGSAVTKEEIADFIKNKGSMAQFYDKNRGDFVFATETAKFIVTPNYTLKIGKQKTKVVNYITATRISGNWNDHFSQYDRIK